MPRRSIFHATDEYYHIFNRGLDRRITYYSENYYQRFIECLNYYQYIKPSIKLSTFLNLSKERQNEFRVSLSRNNRNVSILCYAIMPNHFHLLLKQHTHNGISSFISLIENSYTRYFNFKQKRKGVLFDNQFKSVHIETEEQLLHLSRYIHLNPYTGFVVNTLQELERYKWSSLHEYLTNKPTLCDTNIILSLVKNYKKFVFDQAEYQKQLKKIEHLTF